MGAIVDDGLADIAQGLDGFCVSEVKRIAAKYKVYLICGMVERNPDGKPYNCQFVVSDLGELVTRYHKNHLFTESAEPELYAPGQELVTFELDGWKCGISTCFDIRFPRLFEAYKQQGVEVVFSGFNWVEGRNKPAIMEHLVKARAHENQCFFVAVDRTGSDPNTSYYGTTIISTPYSENIVEMDNIYGYGRITKADIATLARVLPLSESFKAEYRVEAAS
jgi:predicted amidohydrolase